MKPYTEIIDQINNVIHDLENGANFYHWGSPCSCQVGYLVRNISSESDIAQLINLTVFDSWYHMSIRVEDGEFAPGDLRAELIHRLWDLGLDTEDIGKIEDLGTERESVILELRGLSQQLQQARIGALTPAKIKDTTPQPVAVSV